MYNIDNKVLFNPEKSTLRGIGEGAGVDDELARPTCRLLLELIKRKDTLVTREELLNLVWADYGGIPSESNLNNHLTLLRKRFDFWGISRETIETIPRKGVILKATIYDYDENDRNGLIHEKDIILNESPASNNQDRVVGEVPPLTLSPLASKMTTRRKENQQYQPRFYLILAVILILVLITAYNAIKPPPKTIKDDYVSIEQCHVYPIRSGFIQLKEESRDMLLTALKKRIDNKTFSCKERKDLYVARRPYNKKFYMYVSECKLRNPSIYSTCVGYLFLENE